MLNSPFGSWCLCGKPMELECNNPIPTNYFKGFSVNKAKQIHKNYISQITSCGNSRPDIIFNSNNSIVFESKNFNIKLEYQDIGSINPTIYKNNRKREYVFPEENHELTNDEIYNLNNYDWNRYLTTLKDNYISDIIVTLNNSLTDWMFRLIVTEGDNNHNIQLIANKDKTYLINLSNEKIISFLVLDEDHWKSFNKDKIEIYKIIVEFKDEKKLKEEIQLKNC